MHTPRKFEQSDLVQCKKLIDNYPFATLITHSESGLEANHIPFFLNQSEGKNVLQGHIAKANNLWKNLKDKSDVLVVFNGPNCYITPNHYPTKKEHGKAVPTWNYVTVHVRGIMSYITDKQWNLDMINNLTHQHEANQSDPWSTTDAPDDYIQKMLSAIIGLKIDVLSIKGQWKVSQNQPERNKQGVISGLSKEAENSIQNSDSKKMAELVRQYAT